MRLLLDTHIAFWLASNYSRLKPGELASVMEPDNEIAVSTVSIWELRIKWHRRFRSGERKGPADPLELLAAFNMMNIPVLALSAEHSATGLQYPINHKDPFDELLLTVAQETNMRLLTRDKEMRGHPLAYHVD